MKIYTKTGDKGKTGLFGGERVEKNHPRLEAYGTADELNSHIGYLRTLVPDSAIADDLRMIQSTLFKIGSLLATPVDSKVFSSLEQLNEASVSFLETKIDKMEASLPDLKNFILPGGKGEAAYCHVVRTVCRRFERELVAMEIHRIRFPEEILRYVNRLSDYFFVLARHLNNLAGVKDVEI